MTLAEKIKSVLELPEEASVNKEQAIKNTIDAYANTGKYPLLEKVIQGKTTFQKEYKLFVERHKGWESFLIPYTLKEDEKRLAEENKELVNPYSLTSDALNSITPITGAASGFVGTYLIGAMVTAFISVLSGNNLFGDFMDASSTAAAFVAPLCAAIGCSAKFSSISIRKGLEKEIKMLDEQIEKGYNNKQGE